MNGFIGLTLFVQLTFLSVWAAPIPAPHIPNQKETPGHLCARGDVDFAGYRYKERIAYCRRNVDVELKRAIYEMYNIPFNKRVNYTIDHFIPLSIGGSNQTENLWPEHKKIKELRINLETEVFEDVRDGRITQEEGIQKIIKAKMNPPLSNDL